MNFAGAVEVSPEAIKDRLGVYATGAGRDVKAAAALADGERLRAAVVAMWERRGWVAVATDVGLRLARRPLLFGRPQAHAFGWHELTDVATGPQRTTLTFDSREVTLFLTGRHGEFVRLIETARSALHGSDRPTVDDLRALARTELGRTIAFGFESNIDALPDHLQPGERVERLAGASLDFTGLLVLTDRRLLLFDVTVRRASEREWSQTRDTITAVEPTGDGLRLRLRDDAQITLSKFFPLGRRDEFAAMLAWRMR